MSRDWASVGEEHEWRQLGRTVEIRDPKRGYTFTFRRLDQGRSTLQSTLDVQMRGKRLERGHLNLLAPLTRTKFAQAVQKNAQKEFGKDSPDDWERRLHSACVFVEEILNEIGGWDDVTSDLDEVEVEPDYFMAPLLYRDEINIFFGREGGGKSLIALAIAASTATPGFHLPYGWKPKEHGPVLYLDYETASSIEHKRRFKRFLAGLNLKPKYPIIHNSLVRPLPDIVEPILEKAVREGVVLVVIDGLLAASGGDAIKLDDVLPTVSAMRELPGTKLAIGHPPKGNDRTFYGSQQWRGHAREMWIVRADPEDPSLITLHQDKVNYAGRDTYPYGIRVDYNDDTEARAIRMNKEELDPTSDLAEYVSMPERILRLLRRRPHTTPEIIQGLQAPKNNTVYRALNRLEEKGLITSRGVSKNGVKTWVLIERHLSPPPEMPSRNGGLPPIDYDQNPPREPTMEEYMLECYCGRAANPDYGLRDPRCDMHREMSFDPSE